MTPSPVIWPCPAESIPTTAGSPPSDSKISPTVSVANWLTVALSATNRRLRQSQATAVADKYPAKYRQAIVSTAKARKLDPRFILALIKQESVFRPTAKSPAVARGVLQLTIDAAQK